MSKAQRGGRTQEDGVVARKEVLRVVEPRSDRGIFAL